MAAEKNFENKVKKYLDNTGAWYIKYWAGNKFTKEGIPDILACISGKFYAIEIKADNGRPSLMQLVTLRKIRKAGGVGILLYPRDWEKFIQWIEIDGSWYAENIDLQNYWFDKLNT